MKITEWKHLSVEKNLNMEYIKKWQIEMIRLINKKYLEKYI